MTDRAAAVERGLVSIVIATFNERENIGKTIDGIFSHVRAPFEVIVVDDDSPDKTWHHVAEREDPRVKVIRRIDTRGLASAFNRGIIESRGELVGWMDADTTMPPALLPAMLEALRTHDLAIGSRYAPGGEDLRTPLRVLASRMINGFARLVLGGGVGDYDSGFVLLHRHVFDKVTIIPTGYGAYFIEFLYQCLRKGFTLKEIPYRFRDRTEGYSKSFPSLWRFFVTGLGYVQRILWARVRIPD